MTIIDINTKEVIYNSPNFPEHISWSTKKEWDKYVREVNEWGNRWEKKLYYDMETPGINMESIKTFDSLDEAIHYRPIWPDYDLQYDNYYAGIKSYVRKQDNDGVWQLISVISRWEFGNIENEVVMTTEEQAKQLLQFVQCFTTQCYKVLLFWKFPNKGEELVGTNGRPIGGEIDPSQISEKERLIPIYR